MAGINPHAGENGMIGTEEIILLRNTINRLKKKKIKIQGPYSADSIINKENLLNSDAIVFNYHDQALIPFKLLDNFNGINYTLGLSIIRVSPDHGTGYNLVGKNLANGASLNNCFKYILKITKNRGRFVKS